MAAVCSGWLMSGLPMSSDGFVAGLLSFFDLLDMFALSVMSV